MREDSCKREKKKGQSYKKRIEGEDRRRMGNDWQRMTSRREHH
jgi:hypothetical protein